MVRLWAVLAASIVLAGCASGRVSFDNVTPAAPVRVQAEEFRPQGPGAFPAVVLMHGCHGVSPAVRGWGGWLRARGYVALVVGWRYGMECGAWRKGPNVPPMAAVVLDHVSKVYADGTTAVSELNLEVGDGEFVVLVGPSGCGKTTALRMIAGLEDISAGTVRIDDTEPTTTGRIPRSARS